MDLGEFARTLRRQKWLAISIFVLVLGVAVGSLFVQDRTYRSTSTIALVPVDQDAAIYILSQVSTIAPLYGEEIRSPSTLAEAQARLPSGRLGRITVRSFDTPVLKIDAAGNTPAAAKASAEAVTEAFLDRSRRNELGIPQLRVMALGGATFDTTPVTPQPKLTLAFGLLLGLGLSVGAALLRENLSGRIDDAATLASFSDAPVYGEIPSARGIARVRSPADLLNEPRMRAVAEALRDLRTNIQFSHRDVRSILVTSPQGQQGKTTVSFGLAVMFARAGARTALVDADLRRGRIAELLDVPRTPGVTEVLAGEPLGSALHKVGAPTVTVIPSGRLLDEPTELIEQQFFSLLHRLERDFDVVIIDGTPLSPINDARVIARYAGLTLLVVRSGSMTRRQLRNAIERLSIISVKVSAVVVNQVRPLRRDSYQPYLEPVEDQGIRP